MTFQPIQAMALPVITRAVKPAPNSARVIVRRIVSLLV
jgi:hypothetical protein